MKYASCALVRISKENISNKRGTERKAIMGWSCCEGW